MIDELGEARPVEARDGTEFRQIMAGETKGGTEKSGFDHKGTCYSYCSSAFFMLLNNVMQVFVDINLHRNYLSLHKNNKT